MFNTIEEYLDALKTEMKDADSAIIQDAQADAREHLVTAVDALREKNPETSESELLKKAVEEYGMPEETASAYKEVERRTSPLLKSEIKHKSKLGHFFGIYTDPYAWGALLYLLIAFVTGEFYFTWAVTGFSLSVVFLIFIFGFPFALLFLLSVRGFALIEGRLVEALLGVRMPRRPLFSHPDMKWFDRLKALITDRQTWLMIVYMLIQFVLGTVYFVIIVTVFAFSLSFVALPFIQMVWNMPITMFNNQQVFLPYWALILAPVGGLIMITIFMHLAKKIGQFHGKWAKWILVQE